MRPLSRSTNRNAQLLPETGEVKRSYDDCIFFYRRWYRDELRLGTPQALGLVFAPLDYLSGSLIGPIQDVLLSGRSVSMLSLRTIVAGLEGELDSAIAPSLTL